jgi:subtilisin-like proprotein convertase family protein
MRHSHLSVFVAAALLLGAGAALADSQSAPEKPWSILDLPEFSGTLADVNEVEPNNTCATSESYTYGDVYHAQITAGDQDWVQFSAAVGELLTLGTDADGTPTVDTVIELWRDDCSAMLTSDDDGGPGTFSLISSYPAPYTGLYHLKIRGFGSTSAGRYKFIGTRTPPPQTVCPLDNYKGYKLDVNLPIPDNNPAGMTVGPIVFPSDGSTILDVVVDVSISHTWVGDLIVQLTHVGPGGTQTTFLLNRPGVPATTVGCSGDLVGTDTNKYYFGTNPNLLVLGESSCPATIPVQCYQVAPENPNGLVGFRNYPKDGNWFLFVSDNASLDTGILRNFSVHLLNEGPVAVEPLTWGQVKSSYR